MSSCYLNNIKNIENDDILRFISGGSSNTVKIGGIKGNPSSPIVLPFEGADLLIEQYQNIYESESQKINFDNPLPKCKISTLNNPKIIDYIKKKSIREIQQLITTISCPPNLSAIKCAKKKEEAINKLIYDKMVNILDNCNGDVRIIKYIIINFKKFFTNFSILLISQPDDQQNLLAFYIRSIEIFMEYYENIIKNIIGIQNMNEINPGEIEVNMDYFLNYGYLNQEGVPKLEDILGIMVLIQQTIENFFEYIISHLLSYGEDLILSNFGLEGYNESIYYYKDIYIITFDKLINSLKRKAILYNVHTLQN